MRVQDRLSSLFVGEYNVERTARPEASSAPVKFFNGLAFLALALFVSGCAPRGLTPEQQAVRDQNKELLEEAKAGKIKWTDYANQANANAAPVIRNSDSLFWQEAFAYRVLLAQKVDEKQITPEEFDYDFKKYLADEQRRRVTNAALIAASMPQPIVTQPIIPRPVTCITTAS
jgi:hypothetical protein